MKKSFIWFTSNPFSPRWSVATSKIETTKTLVSVIQSVTKEASTDLSAKGCLLIVKLFKLQFTYHTISYAEEVGSQCDGKRAAAKVSQIDFWLFHIANAEYTSTMLKTIYLVLLWRHIHIVRLVNHLYYPVNPNTIYK